jgi:hypothetical protein
MTTTDARVYNPAGTCYRSDSNRHVDVGGAAQFVGPRARGGTPSSILYSVYGAVVTTSTTGYADSFAFNQAEMLCFIGRGHTKAIISSKATSAAHKARWVNDTTHYLRDRGVDAATYARELKC